MVARLSCVEIGRRRTVRNSDIINCPPAFAQTPGPSFDCGRIGRRIRSGPNANASRSLLHWDAGEGFASVRIFAQDRAGGPSCADAGKRF
jgi:hypothetical protein